jgi:hypothetical protein
VGASRSGDAASSTRTDGQIRIDACEEVQSVDLY